MAYLAPTSLGDAIEFLSEENVSIVAGGTDFYPTLGEGSARCDILGLTRISELRGISETQGWWRIGAATTWTDIIQSPLPPLFDGLKQAARQVGSVQIQNTGTVAGNLCNASPAADGVPPLLTLDAEIEISSRKGVRRVNLSKFITGVRRVDLADRELVTAIYIPTLPTGARSAFHKLGSRCYLIISITMVSVVVRCESDKIADMRVAVGSCSPVATRLSALERDLKGMRIEDLRHDFTVTDEHLAVLSPLGDVRGSADFRLEAVAEQCRRLLIQAIFGEA